MIDRGGRIADRLNPILGEPTEEVLSWLNDFSVGEYCLWSLDLDNMWQTSCNMEFLFESGDPMSNAFMYCPFCGRTLLQEIEIGDANNE